MIAVLGYCDGFGNDTFVVGIFESEEKAQKCCKSSYNACETRYKSIELNQLCDLDYYDAEPLFKKTRKKC